MTSEQFSAAHTADDMTKGDPGAVKREPAKLDAAHRRLAHDIVTCTRCPRLIEHCQTIARTKRRAYMDWDYWGKPLPGVGDPAARLLIIGLAPAAHGGNRTGRMFTGNGSADWLIAALHRHGFANQPTSTHRGDGLRLDNVFVTAVARCAPPANKPTRDELANCRSFLERELDLLTNLRAVLVLGRIAFDAYVRLLRERGTLPVDVERPTFAHGARYDLGPDDPTLLVSYHPSRQNTQTGRLTQHMFDQVFIDARRLVDGKSTPASV